MPTRLEAWRERFRLRDIRPAPALTHDLLLFAETIAGEPVVIKASPATDQLAAEVEALRAFGEHRAAAVRAEWLEEGAVLLERVDPGTSLASDASEDEAMRITAQLLARRWPAAPASPVAPPLVEFAGALDKALTRYGPNTCPMDYKLLQRALALLTELDASEPVLLHGDLHYDNILRSERAGHVLIDPKGVIGDPAFDVGYLVSRPTPQARDALPIRQAIERRLAFLPEATGQDPQRVAAFAYVAAGLSAAWAWEDHEAGWQVYPEVMIALEERSPL